MEKNKGNFKNDLNALPEAIEDLDEYISCWKKNKTSRKGKIKYKNGDIYEGYFSNDIKEGYGKMTYKNGDYYCGNWVNNKKEGKGKMIYNNGGNYENFLNNLYKSIFKNKTSGDKYNGNWIKDKKHGEGEMIYFNGDKYLMVINIKEIGLMIKKKEKVF